MDNIDNFIIELINKSNKYINVDEVYKIINQIYPSEFRMTYKNFEEQLNINIKKIKLHINYINLNELSCESIGGMPDEDIKKICNLISNINFSKNKSLPNAIINIFKIMMSYRDNQNIFFLDNNFNVCYVKDSSCGFRKELLEDILDIKLKKVYELIADVFNFEYKYKSKTIKTKTDFAKKLYDTTTKYYLKQNLNITTKKQLKYIYDECEKFIKSINNTYLEYYCHDLPILYCKKHHILPLFKNN